MASKRDSKTTLTTASGPRWPDIAQESIKTTSRRPERAPRGLPGEFKEVNIIDSPKLFEGFGRPR
eukprot:7598355-Pyramimonas_sp.AAC.1